MNRLKTAQELFKRERRPGDLVFAIAFVLFSLFLLWSLPTQAPWREGVKLVAQPALWPTISVVGMVFFAGFHCLGSLCSPRIHGRLAEVILWVRAVEFGGWFVAYVLVLPVVGYLSASLILAVALSFRLGYRSARSLLSAAALAVVTVALFRGFLKVNLPAGSLYQVLPDGLRAFAQTYL
ncbi:tripartite tricarboxylate transporter TctB family protein [Primorskyibacter sp. 2E107]|uniref:tripartite tricarboxylate transporter TctB family protein n=1 Tax=Primorskyibacter sp. 2E107 TaxID=3403458 RepID=UPI003AF7ECBD